jgi:glycosyltransferase involved in cell wall biosynthesis
MKIGLDISQIAYEGTGVARFTQGLVDTICRYDTNNHWIFFFSSLRKKIPASINKTIAQSNKRIVSFKLPPTFLNLLWNQWRIFKLENIFPDLDWFITSDWNEPPAKKIKKATIVHDLAFLRFPQTVLPKIIQVQKKRLCLVQQESQLVIADSQSTKDDLINLLHFSQHKIKVIYPGVKISAFSSITPARSFNLRKNYLLTVGKIEPRKNLPRLINAFLNLKRPDIDLAIVGPPGWENLNLTLPSNIKLLGLVTDKELDALYKHCLFFIYPSIWEGFGYPIIEAMQRGVPVACSNTSSLKEIAGEAALTFDPFIIEDITQKLTLMLNKPELRQIYAKRGLIQQKKFTWQNYYNKLITALNQN